MARPNNPLFSFMLTALFSAVFFVFLPITAQAQMPEGIWSEQSQSLEELPEEAQPAYPEMDPIIEEEQEEISVEMIDKPVVRIRMLNKITAATRTYDLDVEKPVSFDGLRIQPRACKKAPPIANPESASFLEIWEIPAGQDKPQWIFSGWMFASSPGLSAMDHPVYDVWVLDCLDEKGEGKKKDVDVEPEAEISEDSEAGESQEPASAE
jgi:hypothetical protein